MENKKSVVVVVPVHSPTPTKYELISFKQCLRILKNHDIVVVAPVGLDLGVYNKEASNLKVKFIDAKWQSSRLNYNKLKLSRFFYKLFIQYEFLLTYELDAFIFKDDIAKWCDKRYDFIGAPWFRGYDNPTDELLGVGNSGFSLRRISAIKKLISQMYSYSNTDQYQKQSDSFLKKLIKLCYFNVRSLKGENFSIQRFQTLYEDHFLCEVAAEKNPGFRVAPISEAIKFSFEANPELLFEMNERQLPMGCHAWQRYNPTFWKPYIESFGYKL